MLAICSLIGFANWFGLQYIFVEYLVEIIFFESTRFTQRALVNDITRLYKRIVLFSIYPLTNKEFQEHLKYDKSHANLIKSIDMRH